MEKSLRIKANIGQESVVHVQMKKDVDMFEMLSLSLSTEGVYKRHSSNYGVIIGRVTVNGGLGVPNAKISIFIPLKASDALRPEIKSLYPYKNVTDLDSDGRRYNLLPMNYNDNVHVAVGSFPTSQAVLDNDIYLEIYEKYYKYTTITNEAGDYMLYGVPTGTQTIHMDVDISDIGYLSQKPYHMIDKGYSEDMFESPTKFKGGTNLDLLPQIFTENEALNVYPFWGDEEEDEIAITRKDFELQYEITPTCIFMGSVVTDSDDNYISEGCTVSEKSGEMSQLRASEGKIEVMRYNVNGDIEEITIKDSKLIDGNGVFCFQVPMNLNYITTSEEGKLVRSLDPSNGIPTTAKVRFKFTLEGESEDIAASHAMSYLVPNNPDPSPIGSKINGQLQGFVSSADYEHIIDAYSTFSNKFSDEEIKDDCFRDLLWNCVYSVKNYIPRVELRDDDAGGYYLGNGLQHTGIKGVNKSGAVGKNPFPYNKLNLSTSFLTWYTSDAMHRNLFTGRADSEGNWYLMQILPFLSRFGRFFRRLRGFFLNADTYESIQNEDEVFARNLEDTDGISFDFYNDWINGCLYFPKVKYDTSSELCDCNKNVSNLNVNKWTKYVVNDTCALDYYFGHVGSLIPIGFLDNGKDFCKFEDGYLTTANLTRECIKESIYKHSNWKWMGLEKENEATEGRLEDYQYARNTFLYNISERDITNGLTVKKTSNSDAENVQFYYAPLFFNDNEASGNTFNGFKTDIILLGSIDDTNFHGIPSVKGLKLPKTTATLVDTYRSDAAGKNYNVGVSEGGSEDRSHNEVNTGDWVLYENRLRNADDVDQRTNEFENASTKTGDDVEPTNGSLCRTSLYRMNGSFWGSTEYANIRVRDRFVRYWAPWRFDNEWSFMDKSFGVYRLLWDPNQIKDSSVYFSYKENSDDDWDGGMHCLLGGGLFFGKSRLSMFQNNYVTKPKTGINLARICELSVADEDNVTFPNKNERSSTGNQEWDTNIQFQFITTPLSNNIPKAENNISDPNFFDAEKYHSPGEWVGRPPITVDKEHIVWVSSRIVKLSSKSLGSGYWRYQSPCVWFRWGYNAVNTTEYEYVFVTTPSGVTSWEVVSTYEDGQSAEAELPDLAGRINKDDLYCPQFRYVIDDVTYNKEFSNNQSFFVVDNGDEIQWISYRSRNIDGTWNRFTEVKQWNTIDEARTLYYYNPGARSLTDIGPYTNYTNSGLRYVTTMLLDGFWTTANYRPTYSLYYSTPQYPTEFTWGMRNVVDDIYMSRNTILTNIYGVMGGTLNDGSERVHFSNINYIECGMTGIIGDNEITDFTNRSLFATLNSVKLQLIPDEHDESKTPSKRYDMKVMNINGFDGFLKGSVLKTYYSTGSEGQNEIVLKHEETRSDDYAGFRYGKKPKFNEKLNSDWWSWGGSSYRFPVYENSFYFYFGIDSSQTALHKLKSNFL